MSNLLAEICIKKVEHVARCKRTTSLEVMTERAKRAYTPRLFQQSLRDKVLKGHVGLIAEIKKASPSKGLICKDYNPLVISQHYQNGGATCLSVLTDEPYFQGHMDHLSQAHAGCTLPVLRKDFILDSYQVVESRAYSADCILLIMAALSDAQAKELEATAIEWHMDVLVEVHNQQELERALTHLQSRMIGINNRNLSTLQVDLAVSEALAPMIPKGYLVVCESGIQSHADIQRMQQSDLHCFLVGESLMLQRNIEAATRALIGG